MIRLMLWVTSRCTLDCPFCSQGNTRRLHSDYEMSLEELKFIIDSSRSRGLRYETVEFTGGEPTLWTHLEEAAHLVFNSGICNNLFLVTNGNNPERIRPLLPLLDYYCVSSSQANAQQVDAHKAFGHRIYWNEHKHKQIPTVGLIDVLPAECCVRVNPDGTLVNTLMYLKGMVYYCCNAYHNSKIISGDSGLYCRFEEDFALKFSNKNYDKQICRICLCNRKVWEVIK